ncbi:uncharacterized protein VTP21DRAFT_905 [Calcarisporiella thermophila]|uniref:uncharacterized protein n=1 Tax=Calcarisporiella thermophila TaxID=911321 RepID=UPI0037435956
MDTSGSFHETQNGELAAKEIPSISAEVSIETPMDKNGRATMSAEVSGIECSTDQNKSSPRQPTVDIPGESNAFPSTTSTLSDLSNSVNRDQLASHSASEFGTQPGTRPSEETSQYERNSHQSIPHSLNSMNAMPEDISVPPPTMMRTDQVHSCTDQKSSEALPSNPPDVQQAHTKTENDLNEKQTSMDIAEDNIDRVIANAVQGKSIGEEDYESSDLESSDEESSSDSSSSDNEGAAAENNNSHAMDEDEDEDAIGNGVLRTRNEIAVIEVEKPNLEITEDMTLVELGEVQHKVSNVVVIRGNVSGDYMVLDTGSVLVLENKEILGSIFETFGPVTNPMYSVLIPTSQESAEDILPGRKVFYIKEHASFVFTQALKAQKGSDASNIYDEEVGEEEMEFSDDEKEAEHKRKLKKNRKARGGKAEPHEDDHDYKILQRPSNLYSPDSTSSYPSSAPPPRHPRPPQARGRGRHGRPHQPHHPHQQPHHPPPRHPQPNYHPRPPSYHQPTPSHQAMHHPPPPPHQQYMPSYYAPPSHQSYPAYSPQPPMQSGYPAQQPQFPSQVPTQPMYPVQQPQQPPQPQQPALNIPSVSQLYNILANVQQAPQPPQTSYGAYPGTANYQIPPRNPPNGGSAP